MRKTKIEKELLRAFNESNMVYIAYILDNYRINPNIKDKEFEPLLVKAVRTGDTDIVKRVLNYDSINVNAKNKFGRTALMYACVLGTIDIVEQLLKFRDIEIDLLDNKDRDSHGLAYACEKYMGCEGFIDERLMLERGTAFNAAESLGHENICYLLVKRDEIGPEAYAASLEEEHRMVKFRKMFWI